LTLELVFGKGAMGAAREARVKEQTNLSWYFLMMEWKGLFGSEPANLAQTCWRPENIPIDISRRGGQLESCSRLWVLAGAAWMTSAVG